MSGESGRVEHVHREDPLAGAAGGGRAVVELGEVHAHVVGAVRHRDRVGELAPALVLVERLVVRPRDRLVRRVALPARDERVGAEARAGDGGDRRAAGVDPRRVGRARLGRRRDLGRRGGLDAGRHGRDDVGVGGRGAQARVGERRAADERAVGPRPERQAAVPRCERAVDVVARGPGDGVPAEADAVGPRDGRRDPGRGGRSARAAGVQLDAGGRRRGQRVHVGEDVRRRLLDPEVRLALVRGVHREAAVPPVRAGGDDGGAARRLVLDHVRDGRARRLVLRRSSGSGCP